MTLKNLLFDFTPKKIPQQNFHLNNNFLINQNNINYDNNFMMNIPSSINTNNQFILPLNINPQNHSYNQFQNLRKRPNPYEDNKGIFKKSEDCFKSLKLKNIETGITFNLLF